MRKSAYTIAFFMGCASLALAIEAPRLRPSPYFGSLSGLEYTTVDELGRHDYSNFFGENNALIYTARAGYIDMGHLRESADRTRYLFEVCYDNICRSNKTFSYEVIEPAIYHVSLTYPDNWDQLSPDEQSRIAREVAIDLGRHFAHMSTVWHEIVTWFGYASTGLFAETASSFSWEDGYSDLLGTIIAAEVLRDGRQTYNDGVTDLIVQRIRELDPQPVETAKKATKAIKGEWYSGRYPFLSMKKRNFDVGFDDGYISPFRVPGISDGAVEEPLKVPEMEALDAHGFTLRLTMTPQESESDDVLEIIYPAGGGTTLEPKTDFPEIIRYIRAEAVTDKGAEVDQPTL